MVSKCKIKKLIRCAADEGLIKITDVKWFGRVRNDRELVKRKRQITGC